MANATLTKEQEVLLNLTAMSISDSPQNLILPDSNLLNVDFKDVLRESIINSITFATFNVLSFYKKYISDEIYNAWNKRGLIALSNNYVVNSSQNELIKILNENNFKYTIIKGTSSSIYYPHPEYRALGDVDFLIDSESCEEITNVLIQNGYVKNPENHISHIIFNKENAHLEMHFKVAGIPNNEHKEEVENFLKLAIETSVNSTYDNSVFKSPSSLFHGVIIILHTQHHLLNEGLGLRHLCDFATFVNKTKDEKFWVAELIPFLKRVGLYNFVNIFTNLCVKYLNIEKPSWATNCESSLLDELILDILSSGNFGCKDVKKAKSAVYLAQKGEKDRGKLFNVLKKLHNAVLIKYPIVKKLWILYPFLFIYRFLRHLILIIFGKRQSVFTLMPEAEKRNKLYKKLKIFKTKK